MSKGYAVVTGGSRGIGEAISLQLAREGYDVLINYTSSAERAEKVKQKLMQDHGVKAATFKADVSKYEEVKAMRDFAVAEFGKDLAVLVNNAGVANPKPFVTMTPEDYTRTISVDLFGTMHTSNLFVPLMIERNLGRVIIIASTAGLMPQPGYADYSAAKGAQIAFMRAVAAEWGAHNITVNTIAPGFIATEGTAAGGKELEDAIRALSPLRQIGHVEDIQQVFSYLINSPIMTGQTIAPNSGIFMP